MSDIDEKKAFRALAILDAKSAMWWEGSDLQSAVRVLNVSDHVKDWIERLAKMAWVEGAETAVTEYGNELRAAGVLPAESDEAA